MSETSKYIDIWKYKSIDYPFQIFIGGRGTGKTFSALSEIHNEDKKLLLMRRTAQELDLMMDSQNGEGANPFKPINRTYGYNVGLHQIVKNLAGIYDRSIDEESGKYIYEGQPIGYAVALSTISSIRGLDFSDVTDLIYDEFIPESHVKRIKEEGTAFLNAYETIARNRELEGLPPLRAWLLANSNNIYNPIFVELGIVNMIEKMLSNYKYDKYMPERGLAVHLVNNAKEFVDGKSTSALYKLTAGSEFYNMALKNEFAYNDFSLIEHKNLKGYVPVCSVGMAYIYKKKGEYKYHVSYSQTKCPHFDIKTEQDRIRFMRYYGTRLMPEFIQTNLTFESYELKEIVLNLLQF